MTLIKRIRGVERMKIFINCTICFWINIIYFIKEPFLLRLARRKYSNIYKYEQNPLVSIIIATYNRSAILADRTIPALLAQTYENIEIIIVGDCCIDDTAIKVGKYNDPRIIFHDLKKRGKYPTNIKDRWFVQGTKPRNVGMQIASGSWFVFISDDDIPLPNYIEILLRSVQKDDFEFLSASYEEERNNKIKIVFPSSFDSTQPQFICGGMQTWIYRSYLRFCLWNIHSWRKTINRPVDYDLILRFYKYGVRMSYITDVVCRVPSVSGTSTVGYEAALQVGD